MIERNRSSKPKPARLRTAKGTRTEKRVSECSPQLMRAHESQQWHRLIVENVRDFAIFSADLNGLITSWNPGAERFFGYTEAEILGKHMELLYVEEDREAGIAEREKAQAAKQGFSEDERWHLRKDGTRFFVFGMVNAMYDDQHRLCGFIKIARDITQRKDLQSRLERCRDDLETTVAERTAELSEAVNELEAFSYSLSHDLRAPLRAMQGFSEVILAKYGSQLPAEARELLERIVSSGQRLDALIRDALSYHRVAREPLKLQTVDLDRLLQAIITEQPELFSDHNRVEIKQPLLKVTAHEPSLTQCLFNLLGNALRFTTPHRTPHVKIWTEPVDDQVRVWVEDNGIGIREGDQEKIWKMFIRLHPEQYRGTGIGLAIVRKAVERMGGTVGVQSQPGVGSRFWLQLPAADGTSSPGTRSKAKSK